MLSGSFSNPIIVLLNLYFYTSFVVLYVMTVSRRLKVERAGGGWCPKPPVERGVREWLQVDLKNVHMITGIQTQGRFGNGRGLEYAEEYTIEYMRPGLADWKQYRRWDSKQVSDIVREYDGPNKLLAHNTRDEIRPTFSLIIPVTMIIHRFIGVTSSRPKTITTEDGKLRREIRCRPKTFKYFMEIIVNRGDPHTKPSVKRLYVMPFRRRQSTVFFFSFSAHYRLSGSLSFLAIGTYRACII